MKFYNSLLRITPEAFKAININLTRSKSLSMINSQMPISTKHKSIIASKFISVHNRASSHCFYSHRKKRLSSNVLYNIHSNSTISLENTEYRDLVISTSSSFPFAFSTKIGFIKLYLCIQKILGIFSICHNSNPEKSNGLQNRWIAQLNLLGNLPGRYLQFKQLYDPKPFLKRYIKLVNPSAGKVMKSVTAALAAIPFIQNSIDFIASIRCAKNMAILPSVFPKVKTCFIFCFSECFKCV
jgi:hypothetical protein